MRRGQEVLIPTGSTVLKRGDRISVMLATHYATRILEMAGIRYKPVRSVMIAAGGNVGYYLAKKLCEDRIDVTIVDSREEVPPSLVRIQPAQL